MRNRKFISKIMLASILGLASTAHATEVKYVKSAPVVVPSEEYDEVYEIAAGPTVALPKKEDKAAYPESAIAHSYQQEIYEIKKAEEAEQKAMRAREEYDNRKGEAEREIATRKYKIETLKLRQDQVNSEIEALNTDLKSIEKNYKEVNDELSNTEKEANDKYSISDSTKKELEESIKRLEASADSLKNYRDKTQKDINQSAIEVQRMRTDLAALESQVESLETKKASLEADEFQTRSEWVAIRKQIEEAKTGKEESLNILSQYKQKLSIAQRDFRMAQAELDEVEKDRKQTAIRVAAEVKKMEQSTLAAQQAKAVAVNEKIRTEAESERLKFYVASVKKANEDAVEAMRDAQNQVMESRLAFETNKADLSVEMASGNEAKEKHNQNSARIRGLAAVAESSDMLDGGKPWNVTKGCQIHKRMVLKSDNVIGKLTVGQKIVGAPVAGSWIKILNSSGDVAYVASECGKFDE